MTVSISPRPRGHFLLSLFPNIVILVGAKWHLMVVVIYISLMTNDIKHLFMGLFYDSCLITFPLPHATVLRESFLPEEVSCEDKTQTVWLSNTDSHSVLFHLGHRLMASLCFPTYPFILELECPRFVQSILENTCDQACLLYIFTSRIPEKKLHHPMSSCVFYAI